ncbi:hypothetical protein J6590_041860 [Homalodisca vitripennis]|nr:hypothetical protein J6590_041860 [Homalodisca vitripennis]
MSLSLADIVSEAVATHVTEGGYAEGKEVTIYVSAIAASARATHYDNKQMKPREMIVLCTTNHSNSAHGLGHCSVWRMKTDITLMEWRLYRA